MLLRIFVSLKKELIMKKILLGTTGLVAVALLATAASADTPKVTLGGFSNFQAGFTNDDKDANSRSGAFRNDNEVTVKVDGKTDGGLGYGAQIDLEADTTADADNQGTNASRTFTYLQGAWGRVELGDNKSVASTMRVDASTLAAATGGINGAWTYFVNGVNTASFITTSKLVTEHGSTTAFGDESEYNSTKVSYYTPKFSGFQAGVSYTPSLSRGQTIARADNNAGDIGNIWDLGLGYEGTFSGVKLAAAGTYELGEAETAATEDTKAYNIGALVGFQGFSVAGSYGDWSDSDNTAGRDSDYWTLGGGYTAGPIGLSATYIDSTRDVTATTQNEFQNLVLGAEYKLAAGLTPYAEVSFYEFDSAGVVYDNQGTTVILGTQVAF
jgi:outer membrane protein OmpU